MGTLCACAIQTSKKDFVLTYPDNHLESQVSLSPLFLFEWVYSLTMHVSEMHALVGILMCCVAFLSYRHESCVFGSGSSARATQPFPSVNTTTRCLSLSRSVFVQI